MPDKFIVMQAEEETVFLALNFCCEKEAWDL